jgi:C-terminal novel E3 ligase, LRR-interacting
MSSLSDVRVKRWFKKSASEQYLYAKNLSPAQRGDLERTLEKKFRNPGDPQAQEALSMWLSVQQARLRTHTDEQKSAYRSKLIKQVALPAATIVGLNMAAPLFVLNRRDYHESVDRPEYATAFDNFMQIIGDEYLSMDIRTSAAQKLVYHARQEGTIGHNERFHLALNAGMAQIPPDAIPAGIPNRQEIVGAFGLAKLGHRLNSNPNAVYIGSVADDIGSNSKPLGVQMNAWLREAGEPQLKNAKAFDGEENAASFARLLERRMPAASFSNATITSRYTLAKEGAMVMQAIAEDPDLRGRVFAMAENALGTCGDNVAEGFSTIVLAVRNHQMAEAVRDGRVGSAELNRWGLQQFAQDALEKEVNDFIERSEAQMEDMRKTLESALRAASFPDSLIEQVTQDPRTHQSKLRATIMALGNPVPEVESALHDILALQIKNYGLREERVEAMLHAKVALGEMLGLPDSTPKGMLFEHSSKLTGRDLKSIGTAVLAAQADPSSVKEFLVSNDIWLAGMKQLHAEEFEALERQFDDDPFHDMDLPRDGDEHVAEQMAYVEAANDFTQRKTQAESALLLKCAGLQ